ncbi:MAG: hypothetical protein HQK91_05545 [Nitrospirae bacterium]|nr:hypothetical protein [Nitrospirota bacterium]
MKKVLIIILICLPILAYADDELPIQQKSDPIHIKSGTIPSKPKQAETPAPNMPVKSQQNNEQYSPFAPQNCCNLAGVSTDTNYKYFNNDKSHYFCSIKHIKFDYVNREDELKGMRNNFIYYSASGNQFRATELHADLGINNINGAKEARERFGELTNTLLVNVLNAQIKVLYNGIET